MKDKTKKVVCAMSGGVDSSVSAALLKGAGFDVVGMFMKCWQDDVGFTKSHMGACPAEEDEMWARRAAAKIGIPFYSVDLVQEYKQRVVEYFVSEYKAGRTPNPDVMCNREIKFGVFYDMAMNGLGANYVATGHYARLRNTKFGFRSLLKGKDPNKDQSYFLWAVEREKFRNVLFPVGGYLKSEVRKFAQKFRLPNAKRPDSQGICFIGKVEVGAFLRHYIEDKPGTILDFTGKTVGAHRGLHFYTIGQRQGINIGGGPPYYVAQKNYAANTLVVAREYDEELFQMSLYAAGLNWIARKPRFPYRCKAKLRYRQEDQDAIIKGEDLDGAVYVEFREPQRAVTSGQSVVFYKGEELVAGGVIRN